MVLVSHRPLISREWRRRRLHPRPHMLLNRLARLPLLLWSPSTVNPGLYRRQSTFVRGLHFCVVVNNDVSHWDVVVFTKPRAGFRVVVAKCTGRLVRVRWGA